MPIPRPLLLVLIVLNAVVLLGQLWPGRVLHPPHPARREVSEQAERPMVEELRGRIEEDARRYGGKSWKHLSF
jgi:hypothetical protein